MKNAVQYELKSEIEHLNEQLAIKRVREFAERFEKSNAKRKAASKVNGNLAKYWDEEQHHKKRS